MVLTFDSEVSSVNSELLQTQSDETLYKRPRLAEGLGEIEDDAKPKRRKSDDEDPASSAKDIRDKLRRLQISAGTIKTRAQLADKATAYRQEKTVSRPLAEETGKQNSSTLTFQAKAQKSPSEDVQIPRSPQPEASKITAASSISVQTCVQISPSIEEMPKPSSPNKVGYYKDPVQEDVSSTTMKKSSPQPQVATLRYSMRDETIRIPEDAAPTMENDNVDQSFAGILESSHRIHTEMEMTQPESLPVASPASIKTSTRHRADIVSVGKFHSKSEVIEVSQREAADTNRIVSPRSQKAVLETLSLGVDEPDRSEKGASRPSAITGKTVEGPKEKLLAPDSVTVERKVAQVHPFRQEPLQQETKESNKTNLPASSQKSDQSRWQTKVEQQPIEAEVYQQVEVIEDAHIKDHNVSAQVETKDAIKPPSTKTVSSSLKAPQQKTVQSADLHAQQNIDLLHKAGTTAQRTEVKTPAPHEPIVQSLISHHHFSETLKTDIELTPAVDEKIRSVMKTEPATPVRSEERRLEVVSKKAPSKAIKDEASREARAPESPINLDKLLQRNQKYLEAEVKKKLQRQHHVVGSSSSEAEKKADGTLAPGRGKKKRISPQMRRRIKERSKSRERSEAEKEAIRKAQEVSAAEVLASPETKLPAEIGVSIHQGHTVQSVIKDLKDENKKPTDSDSTMTSVTESLTHSVTGSEEYGRRKRKDKSSARKSQLNLQDSTEGSQETSGKSNEHITVEARSTPRGQRSSERTKTTPVTPEEVQHAAEQVARQREQRIAEGDDSDMKTSAYEGRVSSHDLGKLELRPMGIAPNRVSSALSKLQNSANKNAETRPKTSVDDSHKGSKLFARGKDFSSLLEKFSSSESSEETERQRRIRVNARRLDFPSTFSRSGTPSSDESNTERERPRRTPERTGSLKERAKQFEGGNVPKIVQRSSSFKSETAYKSDFMKRAKQQQEEEKKAPNTKFAKEPETVPSSRDMGITSSTPTVNKDSVDTNNVTETQITKSSSKSSILSDDTKMDEVIADSELLNVLKSRRKHSDAEFHDAFEDLPNGRSKSKSSETEIAEVIADQEVARVLQARRKDTDSKIIEKDDVFEDTVESQETQSVIKAVQSSSKTDNQGPQIVEKKQTESSHKTKIESKPPSGITTTTKSTTTKSSSSRNVETSKKQELQRSQTLPERSMENVEISTSRSQTVFATSKVTETSSKSSELSASNSLEKQDSVEKPVRGILKRSSSSASDHGRKRSDSETLLDPQLAKVLQSRKKMVDSTVTDDNSEDQSFEDRRDQIRREIAQTDIHKTEESEKEERTISISERIFRMENKIEEAKSCPVTPRTLSGFTTPRSRNRSGASTPRRESLESLEEEATGPIINPLLSADKRFMEKLERMAETENQMSEKRKKFNRRSRDDWRSRTLPVTLEEIQEADRMSLADKLKLFNKQPEEQLQAPPSRSDVPVIRRRNRKQASRFNTQPVTTEEVEKASRISPLAMSLAKPPDNELLRCLPIAAQIEMMALHAEANLSQPSSRAGSQPSSRAGSQPSSRRSSVGSESLEAEESGILKTAENKDQQEVKSILKHDGRKSSDSEIRGILKDGGKDNAEPRGILKHGESDGELASPSIKSPEEPSRGILKHGDANDAHKGQKSALRRDPKGKSEGDLPRSILKRDSLEENKIEPDKGVLKKSRSQDFKESAEIRGILKKTPSSEVKSASCEVTSRYSKSFESVQSASSAEVLVSESSQVSTNIQAISSTEEVTSHVTQSESSTNTEVKTSEGAVEIRKTSKIKNEAVARRRSRETRKAEAERYLTQPADTGASDKTPERKMKYSASRHHTQPITPEEKEAAEAAGSSEMSDRNSGSITERLNQLKKSGEEDWKRRVRAEIELPQQVTMRVKLGPMPERPTSIADRLNKLGESQQRWTARVEETDVKAFTVEGKQSIALDSPITTRRRRLPKRELSFGKGDSGQSNSSSPLQSPSIEKIPLPKELISEGPPVTSVQSTSSSSSKTVVTHMSRGSSDEYKTTIVEVPQMSEESFDTFFSMVEEKMLEEKLDVTVDDFDELFLKSEDVLMPARRIRPKRRHIAQKRNPFKTQSVEIQQEYIEVRTGVAEMELKRIKREGLAKDSSSAQVMLAEAAVKGLQSKENFNIELRSTKDSKILTPGHTDYLPYTNLMLLHVKGRRHVQTRLVEPHTHSVNSGDSYILVTPDRVVNWNGKFSNVIEKARAADIALFISQKRDLGYRSSSVALTIEEDKGRHVANKNFWSLLEGSGESQECGPPDEDGDFESYMIETNMVYKVNNNTLVPYEEFWGKIPKVEMLNVHEVLVFDFGSELYVWRGQQVSMEQRKMGMKLATQLWERGYDYSMCTVNPISPLRDWEEGGPPRKANKRPLWALYGKVNQNMETTLFKEKFFDWPESSRFAVRSKTPDSFALKVVDVNDLKPYDAKLLIPLNTSPATMMFEGSHVGRGDKWVEEMDGLRREFDIMTLEVNVWHVLEYDHFKLPKHSYGQFHDGDTYVVRWQYMITAAGLKTLKGHAARHSLTGRERCAYFFWQGHNSTVNEKGASALMTVELDEERGPQVRVLQGKEPPCFLNLFEGRSIIHIGKREEAETNTQGSHRLYMVRNEFENETCLLEIPQRTENLRSRSSLILLNVETGLLCIWHGAKSPSNTRKLVLAAANKLEDKCPLEVGLHDKASITIAEIEEGSEKAEFWSAIGNKDRNLYQSLCKDKRMLTVSPRLFYMNSVAGVFEATEILNPARSHDLLTAMPFLQYDLYKVSQPGLFLLDDTSTIYLWQGWWPEGDEDSDNVHTGSAQARFNTDRLCAMKTTIQYCKEKCSDHPPTALLVYAGVEPLSFTNLFPFWEVDEEARDSNLRDGRKEGETINVEDVLAKLTQSQYTLEELQERPLPEGADPLKLETYLREEEFQDVLDMSKDDFYAMPNWKQTKLKQKVGLF